MICVPSGVTSDAADTFQEGDGGEPAVTAAAQPDDAAAAGVGRPRAAEVCHDKVLDAVAVEIDDLDVTGVGQRGEHAPARLRVARAQGHDATRAHVGGKDVW